ncbi:M48 family metallopeptidase [Acidiphilium sp.]|uniref:M48 family metallopeptidase n=1 Tax=Acidiphilium sp. TaxID=527 RepID=UPI003D04ABD3
MSPPARTIDEPIVIAGHLTSIRWRRSQRARRVALKIDPQAGGIVITLPPRGSRRAGLALLRGHEAWVADRLAALPALTTIAPGGTIPIFGEPHVIVQDAAHRGAPVIGSSKILVSGQPEFLARRVRDALHALATERFSDQARDKAKRIGVTPNHIRVKDTKSRWGSCTAEGILMFSWRLIMAPDFVQDYVIAHEVAHLRYMNHAPEFWRLTERLTPHRAPAMTWLSVQGPGLLRIV